jgi:hypothetical protein
MAALSQMQLLERAFERFRCGRSKVLMPGGTIIDPARLPFDDSLGPTGKCDPIESRKVFE